MSAKKEPVIEKGIEHSVSPKRDTLVVPPGARGTKSIHPAHLVEPPQQQALNHDDRGPMALDITGLVIRKKEEKRLKKLKEQKERGDVAGKAKGPGSPPSSSSSVSLSPTEIFAYEEEQRLKANLPPLGSPKSVSPRLSPLGRGRGVGARARRKSSSSSSSSSSSKSPKGRKPLTPRFEKVESKSVSPKARGKGKEKEKEGTKRQGGASVRTRKKYKRKLRNTHSRKRR
jgi:hypothetical protein